MAIAFLGSSALCREYSAQHWIRSVSGRAAHTPEIIVFIYAGRRFLSSHSLCIKEELDHVEKVRWKVKRKHRGVENRRHESVGLFVLETERHNSSLQGQKQDTLKKKGIS